MHTRKEDNQGKRVHYGCLCQKNNNMRAIFHLVSILIFKLIFNCKFPYNFQELLQIIIYRNTGLWDCGYKLKLCPSSLKFTEK